MSPVGSAIPELPNPRDGSEGRSVNLVVLERGSARVGYPAGLIALVLCLVLAYVGLELISYWEMTGRP
jgi:hypothetical protein